MHDTLRFSWKKFAISFSLHERDDILLTMIQQRGDVERVTSRNICLPLQIRPGSDLYAATIAFTPDFSIHYCWGPRCP